MATYPEYRDLYEKHPDSGVVYRQTVHDIDARDAAARFPDRYSLIPPLDGKFVHKPTPQSAAMDIAVQAPEKTEEEKRREWEKSLREQWERDRKEAEDRAAATAGQRQAIAQGQDPDRPVLGPPSVDRPINEPDGRGEFRDRSGPAVKMAERGEDPGVPIFDADHPQTGPNAVSPIEGAPPRNDNTKTPPDLQEDLTGDIDRKGKGKNK